MDAPVNKTIPGDGEVNLLDYIIVIVKHSRMIVFTTLVVAAITFLILRFIPNRYTAGATIFPPQLNMTLSAQLFDSLGTGGTSPPGGGGGGGAAGSLGGLGTLLGLKSPGDIYVGVLTGNSIFNNIIERFKLREIYKTKNIESAREQLNKNASINLNDKGLITIEMTDADPERAAAMANAFVEELDKLLQRMAVQEAKERLAFLEKERAQNSLNLTKAEDALRNFSEQNSVIQIDTQAKGMLEYIATLRATIDAKEVQIQVLRQQATPYNFDLVQLETELKSLKERLRAAETQWDQSCVGDVCLPTSKTPALGLEFIRLYREVKFQESLYQLYTKMVELTRLDMAKDVAVVQVVDKALPPEGKSGPKRLLITILVACATGFLCVGYAFWKEYWQRIVNSEQEAERLTLLQDHLKPWKAYFKRIMDLSKIIRSWLSRLVANSR
jgi:tyrosine-protein kinase Etk/Wzc